MSYRIENIVVIEEELEQQCDFCGEISELRPYGPKGEALCFPCAMKDEETTTKQMYKILFGDK